MIFWNDTFEQNMPLYYINGSLGEIKFLGKLPLGTRLDKSGMFLMYEDVYQSGDFVILNTQTGKVEHKLSWNILNKSKWIKAGGSFRILRSADKDEYDFMILFEIESRTVSRAYVKVSPAQIINDFDDSNLPEPQLKQSIDYQSDFTGWY